MEKAGRSRGTVAACAVWLVSISAAQAAERPRPGNPGDRLTVRSTVVGARSTEPVRRPATSRMVDPATTVPSPSGEAWLVVERADADFGEMLPDERRELVGAFVLRVHSERDWELQLVPTGDLEVVGTADRVPLDRLVWRTATSQGFEPFASPAPVSVARGAPTAGAGTVIALDLRLELQEHDPLGRYAVGFRALLDVR